MSATPSLLDRVLGRRLADTEQEAETIRPAAGVAVLGLDALSSAAYGPEAALTVLRPLGAAGLAFVAPISALIIAVLVAVFFSYRQTIATYPTGGGSYTVAKENLGRRAGLLAASALALDYVLNVAVGISAAVGALVSALPLLREHTLVLCLGILVLLTLVNLRGVREAGHAFMLPTYAFVATLTAAIVVGVARTVAAGGHPAPVVGPPSASVPTQAVGAWILLRAFASGCTAMTGVEAVSNGVPIFRRPTIANAQRTLTAIVALLVFLLGGVAVLCRAYGIGATEPGAPGYESVLSMTTAAVFGRGALYFVTMAAVFAVLALSANTSFADFPRLCRVLATDRFLPGILAVRGRRLVFSQGIVLLALLSGVLLVAFGGVTDRLIPLFAIGALLAFTLSQAGMVAHWRRAGGPRALRSLAVNAVGAVATGATVIVVAAAKFGEGAWLTVLVIPICMLFFSRVNRHYRRIAAAIGTIDPLEPPAPQSPIVVLAAGGWNKLMQQGLKFALRLSRDVYVVQVKTETGATDELSDNWNLLIASRARSAGIPEPKLVVLQSKFRQFLEPFVGFIKELEANHPDRDIAVVIPDLVLNHWHEALLHNNRGAFLRAVIRTQCSARVVVVHTAYHFGDNDVTGS
jgi:amino acid transporter